MKKDYIPVSSDVAAQDEIQFVNNFWSAMWEGRGPGKDLVDSVARREEYRIMSPYLHELSDGAKILDGGCGLGEWTVFLSSQKFDAYEIGRASCRERV